jgi:hypothetical protein
MGLKGGQVGNEGLKRPYQMKYVLDFLEKNIILLVHLRKIVKFYLFPENVSFLRKIISSAKNEERQH